MMDAKAESVEFVGTQRGELLCPENIEHYDDG
jgi:hypothetical protein